MSFTRLLVTCLLAALCAGMIVLVMIPAPTQAAPMVPAPQPAPRPLEAPAHACVLEDGSFVTADGGCKDLATGLVWSAAHDLNFTYPSAISIIENMKESGYTDWRMPTRAELEAVCANGASTHFAGSLGYHWSSTSKGAKKWAVQLSDCSMLAFGQGAGIPFRAVRDPGAAPALPNAPTALVATALTSSSIGLTWTDNSGNESGFDVERSSDEVAWSTIASIGPNLTSYTDLGLLASTEYFFRIRATNSAGQSDPSNVASAITLPNGGGTSAFVGCISYSTYGGSNGNKHLAITVRVVDDTDAPLAGLTVSVVVSGPTGATASGVTDASGAFSFNMMNAAFGFYSTDVTSISPGVEFDGGEPTNLFNKSLVGPTAGSFPTGCGS